MAEKGPGSGDRQHGSGGRDQRRRGRSVALRVTLPRYVSSKPLAGESVGFYWSPPTKDAKRAKAEGRPFPFRSVPLGVDLGQAELDAAAKPYNDELREWRTDRKLGATRELGQYGTVRWMVELYLRSDPFLENVGERSRPDYRNTLNALCDLPTKDGRTVGDLAVASITPRAADKLYHQMRSGGRWRRGEKTVGYCRTAWAIVGRLYPDTLAKGTPNPWAGVTLKRRARAVKAAADRDLVYCFAEAAISAGRPECAVAAVVCFEWLQRPENVTAGKFRWTDFDPPQHRGWVRIEHHKTGVVGWHPLVAADEETGEMVRLYPEAERVLAQMPRRGLSVVLGPQGQLYSSTRFANIVRKVATDAGLKGFTLDACRHGGITELEEAGLTEGQGMALSMHKTARIFAGYAKRTQERALGATLKRIAHRKARSEG